MSIVSEWVKRFFRKKETCDTDPGVDALLAVIRTVARVSRGIGILTAGGSPMTAILSLGGGVLPDIIKLVQEYDDIPCEVAALDADSYALLLKAVMTELALSQMDAKTAIASAIRLVSDIKTSPFN